MACVTHSWLAILINGLPTDFFKAGRGLRQGFSLSPLLFILIMDGISNQISWENTGGNFNGIRMCSEECIIGLFFLDDKLNFGKLPLPQWETLFHIFRRFGLASGLVANGIKSILDLKGLY